MIPSYLEMDCLHWEVNTVDLGHDQLGECRPEECQMLIANRLSMQMREQTFYHELVHMLSKSRDLDWEELLKKASDPEEIIARHLGPALYTFLETNCDLNWKPHCYAPK